MFGDDRLFQFGIEEIYLLKDMSIYLHTLARCIAGKCPIFCLPPFAVLAIFWEGRTAA